MSTSGSLLIWLPFAELEMLGLCQKQLSRFIRKLATELGRSET
jgi:hypothetical protein